MQHQQTINRIVLIGVAAFSLLGKQVWAQAPLFPAPAAPVQQVQPTAPDPQVDALDPNAPVFDLDLKRQEGNPASGDPLNTGAAKKTTGITGLIVDARGLDFQPSMSMRLFDPDGNQVYTTPGANQDLNTSFVASEGTAAYTSNEEQARKLVKRIGTRPQIIRAKRTIGEDLVISNEDAWALRQTNETDKFLDKFAVVVIWDSSRASLP